MQKLRPKHKTFADEWLKDQNGQQAAVRAGYSERYARVTAYKILQRPEVKAYLKERTGQLAMEKEEAVELLGLMARKAKSESVRLRALETIAKIHGLMNDTRLEGELVFKVLYGSDDTPEETPPKARANKESSSQAQGDLHGASVWEDDAGSASGG